MADTKVTFAGSVSVTTASGSGEGRCWLPESCMSARCRRRPGWACPTCLIERLLTGTGLTCRHRRAARCCLGQDRTCCWKPRHYRDLGTAALSGTTVIVTVADAPAASVPRSAVTWPPEIVGVTPAIDVVAVMFDVMFCGSASVTNLARPRRRPGVVHR